uniref:GIY-YIG domain-containing protein n=1 Tax=viral metagenome TaxID=1070528 RepID=A0A6C0KA08_9ZZZZ|tara:strand:- start:84 stop:497 length:414 start_codon:yes stop_codon:yes gene_type:complete
MDNWSCYIIENKGYTYVGVSNNVKKRLRAHNGEIKGGAKYTTSKGSGWKHICVIHGFPTKIESMQFEWALKHVPPRNAGGIKNRIKKLQILLHKENWTSKSPLSETMPLVIEWIDQSYRPDNFSLPVYIEEKMIEIK